MRSPRNFFSGRYLERVAHRRKDEDWLRQALANTESFVVPIWRTRTLVTRLTGTPSAWLMERGEVRCESEELIFLGEFRNRPTFAYELAEAETPRVESHQEFTDLRAIAGTLPEDEAGVLAYARAMILWRERHRFCGRCGSRTAPRSAGHVLTCTDEACGNEVFPRIDPAIITLVTDGERALLGRQAGWPAGRYSTIAGFVEPGESLEDAVIREVEEETGIVVEDVEYHSSQPWPFPSSLMLGFLARAGSTEIHLGDNELEDARWFTREQLARGEAGLPPSVSVSFRLIEDWYNQNSDRPLRDEPGLSTWGRR